MRSWSLGADEFLSKPTDPELVAAKLRAHLATTVTPPSCSQAAVEADQLDGRRGPVAGPSEGRLGLALVA